jgi:hypothetical protein
MPEYLPGQLHCFVYHLRVGKSCGLDFSVATLTLLYLPWLTLVILLGLPCLGVSSIYVNEKAHTNFQH